MSRHGAAWTDKEDKYLLEAIDKGESYAKINERCKRTVEEIKTRVNELRSFEADVPVTMLVETSGMEEEEVIPPPAVAKPVATSTKPAARRMTNWSTEEDEQLIKELKEGKTFEQVAESHGRTFKAIQMRMSSKVSKMSNKTIPEIVEATGLSAKQVGAMLGKAIDNAVTITAPAPIPVNDPQIKLLTEIRDLLIQIRDQHKE